MQTVCLFAPSDIFIILSVIYITTLDSHPDLPWRNVLVAKPIKEGSFLLSIQSGGAFEIWDQYHIYNPLHELSLWGQYAGYRVIRGSGSHRRYARKPEHKDYRRTKNAWSILT